MSGTPCILFLEFLNRPRHTTPHVESICSGRSSSPRDPSSCSFPSKHPHFVLPDDTVWIIAITGQAKEKLAGRVLTDLPPFTPPSESDGDRSNDDELFDDETITCDPSVSQESKLEDDDHTVKAMTGQRMYVSLGRVCAPPLTYSAAQAVIPSSQPQSAPDNRTFLDSVVTLGQRR